MLPPIHREKCTVCYGKGNVFCPVCEGARMIDGKTCPRCKGTGRIKCDACHDGVKTV
jgi:DnaJ-class molecular chaperone